jgi:hypothetical protein
MNELKDSARYYLAYGANMNKTQMGNRCLTAKFIGTSFIQDYGLRFHRIANIEPADGECTPVLVWELQGDDEVCLDDWEDYPNSYVKKEFPAIVDGQPIIAIAYVMTENKKNEGKNQPPHDEYLELIREGYRDEGIEEGPIEQALELADGE